MNTLNYIGCKNRLASRILEIVESHADLATSTVADLFMGTGIISYRLSERCHKVIANDLEPYSAIIGEAILRCPFSPHLSDRIDQLNRLDPRDGLLSHHYSPHAGCERMFFTPENARKADAIRQRIEEWKTADEITLSEYRFLLASLLVSLDKVANTTSVYGAYLKSFKRSAQAPLLLSAIHRDRDRCRDHNEVRCGLAEEVDVDADITYLDPPYNQRSYSANYFVLNYVVAYDPALVPRGKTGIIGENTSQFCRRPRVREAFSDLLDNIRSPLVVLSYNNEGLLGREELVALLQERGEVTLYTIPYPKYRATKGAAAELVEEYVWVLDRRGVKGRVQTIAM